MKKLFTKSLLIIALISLNAISLSAQTTVTWILTADPTVNTPSGTGFTAADQVASGFTGGAVVYNKTVGTTTAQAVKTATNSDGSSLPYNVYDAAVYLEYTVTAAANYNLTISNVSMLLAGVSDGTICAKIDYSTDNFATSTNLGEFINLSTSATTTASYNLTSIVINEGSTFKVRVYPKINTAAKTGKYLLSYNAQITFTAEQVTTTGLSENATSKVTFDGRTIQNPENLDLQVFNVAGKRVATSNKDINMSSNANGIYIVKSTQGTLKISLMK